MANILDIINVGDIDILTVDSIPSSGVGTPASLGSIAIVLDGSGSSSIYLKTTNKNTDWYKFAISSANGTIPATLGGTGQASYTIGDILYADTSTTLAKLSSAPIGNSLLSNGSGVAPGWGKIGLTTHVSGVLPAVNGGTGFSTFLVGDILYASSANALSTLPIGINGQILSIVAGVPAWSSAGTGTVTSVDVSGGTTGMVFTGGPVTSSGTITMAGRLAVANGGTGVTTSTGSGSVVLSTAPTLSNITLNRLTLSENISAAAWTTNGIGLAHVSRTITDTTSTGTVAAAYSNVLGGNTIAASSATTYTDYANLFLGTPTAGTNVTMTNKWSLISAGNIKTSGNLTFVAGTTLSLVSVQASSSSGAWTMTLPTSAGTNGYFLQTNGAGVTSWVSPNETKTAQISIGTIVSSGGTSGYALVGNEMTYSVTAGTNTTYMEMVIPADYISGGTLNFWIRRSGTQTATVTAYINNTVDATISASSIAATSLTTWEQKTLTFGSALAPGNRIQITMRLSLNTQLQSVYFNYTG